MKIPTAKELVFTAVTGTLPEQACNFCGKPLPITGRCLIADVMIEPGHEYTVMVCNDQCKESFISHPGADEYVKDGIQNTINFIEKHKSKEN